MVTPRIKFLTGAPESHQLDWNESALLHDLSTPFQPADRISLDVITFISHPESTIQANWRLIALPSDAVSVDRYGHESRGAATDRADVPTILGDDATENNFVEQSLAILDNIQSSQLAPQPPQDDLTVDEDSTLISFADTTLDDSGLSLSTSLYNSPALKAAPIVFQGPITALKSIPSAGGLFQLRPQTVTINIIAGIISVSPTRTVRVRKGNYDVDIVEVMVGDETRAGFSISVWLSTADKDRSIGLRDHVAALRSGDIVLITPIALTTFNGNVYGQSLNRRASRIYTRFEKLDHVTSAPSGQRPDVTAKIERVRAWAENFIGARPMMVKKREAKEGPATGHSPRRSKRLAQESMLPPDSQ